MQINLTRSDGSNVEGQIIEVTNKNTLPSLTDGWRFDFRKQSKKNKNLRSYIIIEKNNPSLILGCLLLISDKNLDTVISYIEISPMIIDTTPRLYTNVAGCLIAFACKLSFNHVNEIYRGYVSIYVSEEDPLDQQRLMKHYSLKYRAHKIDQNTMLIYPEDGINLIKKYFNQ